MKIVKIEDLKQDNGLKEVVDTLNRGGLIIFPTETCYGVGVDARNPKAVTRLLEYKKRPEGKAISIAVDSKEMALRYVDINESGNKMYDTFLPGPLTIVSKSKGITDKRLESEKQTLGVRIPNYKLLLDIIKEFGSPITSTSANLSGKPTPYSIESILENLPEKNRSLIDLVIDAGILPKNPPSTVIDSSSDDLVIFRNGLVNPKRIKSIKKYTSSSVEETISIAENLLKNDFPKIILLDGELGAGKTHFTKGIAKALNIQRIIKSPTYNYFNEYLGEINVNNEVKNFKLIHFDSWRVQSLEDLNYLKFFDWFNSESSGYQPENIIVIEWASIIFNFKNDFLDNVSYYHIEINIVDEDTREIKVYEVV